MASMFAPSVSMALALFLVTAPNVTAAASPSPDEWVLVRFEVDSDGRTRSGISALNFQKWSESQRIAKAFEDAVGGAPKDVLARHVVPRSLDKALDLNKSSAAASTPENRLWIAPFGTAKPTYRISRSLQRALPTYRLALPDDMARVLSDRAKEQDLKIFVPDIQLPPNRLPSKKTIQMELTRDQLASLHAADPNLRTETFNGRFQVVTEATQLVGALPTKPDLEAALGKLFSGKKPPTKKPLMIIVDDAWPTADAFLFTKNLVGSVYPELWKANSDLAAAAPELAAETKKLVSPGPPNGTLCPTLEQCDSHSKRVDMSLVTMRKFARAALGDDPVDVIYVPMTASQQGAKDVLRLLWDLAYAAGTALAPNSPTFFLEEKTKTRQEEEFLASLEVKLRGSEFTSNWAILTSVFHFARRYSVVKEVPVYISLSWTTEDTTFNPPVLTSWSTLVVAAAGNHCEDDSCGKFADEIGPARLFVERASSPIDVLLVVNLNEKGMPTCSSTRVQTTYSVVGFDGAIDGDCGTSFAAPRVAWIMAARYAMAGTAWQTEQKDRLRWLMNRPERRRCGGDNDFPCVRFPTTHFLAIPSTKAVSVTTNPPPGGTKP